MEATKLPVLLTEFHNHRLGAEIEDEQYHDAEVAFFDDLVTGVDARRTEIDAQIVSKLAAGWTIERLDKPMRQILRCGAYELIARPDVRTGTIISERSEEHTSELQSLMRNSYAVFCMQKKTTQHK